MDSIKRRHPKKKTFPQFDVEGLSETPVIALSTAEEYNFDFIQNALNEQGLYQQEANLEEDFGSEILHLTAKYKLDEKKRDFFIFRFFFCTNFCLLYKFNIYFLGKVPLFFGICQLMKYFVTFKKLSLNKFNFSVNLF